jgi:HlyD family secretion protein
MTVVMLHQPAEEMEGEGRLLLASMRGHLLVGAAVLGLLFGALGGWSALTELVGSVISQGQIAVDGSSKKVQHPTGGVVSVLNVSEGDRVKAGDVLVRLDDTATRASLGIVNKSLDQFTARLGRLSAERDDAAEVTFAPELLARADEPEVKMLMAGESSLFALRATSRERHKAQLAERIVQLREEVAGLDNQIRAKGSELSLIAGELAGVSKLYRSNLVPLQRVNQLAREAARLDGEKGQLEAAIAQAHGKIGEIELQILQVDDDLRSDVAKEMRDTEGKIAEFGERRLAAEDQLRRIEMKSPRDGIVHQLAVHTIGGVINPGEVVMLIVPDRERLVVETRIAPQDINNVHPGQDTFIRLTSFNQRTTPEIEGRLQRVSPDLTTDQRTGATYYTAAITLEPGSVARLGDAQLVPGMPAEVFIRTTPRTVLSYLLKPLSDQLSRALRGS